MPTSPFTPFASASLAGAGEDYIVVLGASETDVPGEARRLTALERGNLKAQWEHALKGFVVELTPAAAADLARQPQVVSLAKDGPIRAAGVQSPVGSWGQDRVDQASLPLSGSYTYPNTGAGVHVYIIDTGLNASHGEFAGRVGIGADFTGLGGTADCSGHGTHVAGTVGGTVYGIAKGVTIHPVRVLDCAGNGQWSWYVSAINWVIAHKQLPAVANASLNGGIDAAADQATKNLAAAGVVIAVASGNSNADACQSSPARVGTTGGVIATNATDVTDTRASFSNFGACTDLYAPGVTVKSAWIGSASATASLSGTSMASPHAAGAAALYLAAHPAWTPAQVEQAMKADATTGAIKASPSSTPNRLLNVGRIGAATPPANGAPTAAFTVSCNASTHSCVLDAGASTDDGGAANLSFTWTAASRPTKTGRSITRYSVYESKGQSYQETLMVRDAGGLSRSVTKTVVIP